MNVDLCGRCSAQPRGRCAHSPSVVIRVGACAPLPCKKISTMSAHLRIVWPGCVDVSRRCYVHRLSDLFCFRLQMANSKMYP